MQLPDYYPQITEARRLIAEHAGWSEFYLRTTLRGAPRWSRTESALLVTEEVFNGLIRMDYIRPTWDFGGTRCYRAPREPRVRLSGADRICPPR